MKSYNYIYSPKSKFRHIFLTPLLLAPCMEQKYLDVKNNEK